MKKYNIILASILMAMTFLVGCSNGTNLSEGTVTDKTSSTDTTEIETTETATTETTEKLDIVTTIFPVYDWTREILGDELNNVNLTMLLDNGIDLHSYQATADDIITISNCDLFIYVGGESDDWVDDVLEHATNSDMKALNLMEIMGDSAKIEELVEGMQESEHNHEHDEDVDHDEHEHEHDEDADHDKHEHDEDADHDEHDHDEDADHDEHDHDEDADHDEHEHDEDADHDEHEHDEDADHDEHEHEHDEVEYDEHVWLSLKNASVITQAIADALVAIDSENETVYKENASQYIAALQSLDNDYHAMVDDATQKTILVGDRFPFRYLVDDYDIDYYAAFVGCSAETEASFETITFLANKVDELNLSTVLTIEGAKHQIAETIIAATKEKNQQIKMLNSMQAVTTSDMESGTTYLSIMQDNFEVLRETLE